MKSNKKLTVEIAGGLGNQLFMFYAGLYFEEYFEREVVFDTSDLGRIQRLHPGANIQTLGLLDGHQTSSRINVSSHALYQSINTMSRVFGRIHTSETFISQDVGFVKPELVPTHANRIRGYFQSWIYFNSLSKKPILSLKSLSSPSRWLIEQIEKTQKKRVLSFHVRRGDYSLAANRLSGLLSTNYYKRALAAADDYDSVWIFSDTPNQVKGEFSNLEIPYEIIQPPCESDPVESLLLMSATKNIVISNSTFSWWSAMLSGSEGSIYAPSKWYELREDPTELIPESWNKIESDWVIQ